MVYIIVALSLLFLLIFLSLSYCLSTNQMIIDIPYNIMPICVILFIISSSLFLTIPSIVTDIKFINCTHRCQSLTNMCLIERIPSSDYPDYRYTWIIYPENRNVVQILNITDDPTTITEGKIICWIDENGNIYRRCKCTHYLERYLGAFTFIFGFFGMYLLLLQLGV